MPISQRIREFAPHDVEILELFFDYSQVLEEAHPEDVAHLMMIRQRLENPDLRKSGESVRCYFGTDYDSAGIRQLLMEALEATQSITAYRYSPYVSDLQGHLTLRCIRQKALKMLAEEDLPSLKMHLKHRAPSPEIFESLFGTLEPHEALFCHLRNLIDELAEFGTESARAKAALLESQLLRYDDVFDPAKLSVVMHESEAEGGKVALNYKTTSGDRSLGIYPAARAVAHAGKDRAFIGAGEVVPHGQWIQLARQLFNSGNAHGPVRTRHNKALAAFVAEATDYAQPEAYGAHAAALGTALTETGDYLRQHHVDLYEKQEALGKSVTMESVGRDALSKKLSLLDGWKVLPGETDRQAFFVRMGETPSLAQWRDGQLTQLDYRLAEGLYRGLAGALNTLAGQGVNVSGFCKEIQAQLNRPLSGLDRQVIGQTQMAELKAMLQSTDADAPAVSCSGPQM